MKTLLTQPRRKGTTLAALWALVISLPAAAAIYTYDYSDAGVVPQVGTAFSVEHVIGGLADTSIASVQFTFMFNDNASLLGNSGGIEGHMILGTSEASPHVSFYPVDNSGAGLHTYTLTFSGSSGSPGMGFEGLNPNDTWDLVLWDNGANGIENSLNGYRVAITAVPEPINVALGVFGGVFAGVAVVRRRRARKLSVAPSQ